MSAEPAAPATTAVPAATAAPAPPSGDAVRDRTGALAVGLLVVAVATSSWNALALGPLKVTHATLALACLLLAVRAIRRRQVIWAPAWVWLLAGAIVLVALASVLSPPDPGYFAGRYAEDVPDALANLERLARANAAAGVQWLVAAAALPLAVCLAAPGRPRLVSLLAQAWAAGSAVSGLVAFADLAKVTQVSTAILGSAYFGGREAGLAVHPNHLSLSIVMALPVVVWRLARARRPVAVALPVVLVPPMLAGLLAGGSRAGLAGAALVVLVALVVEPRTRRLLPALAGISVLAAGVVVVAVPGVLAMFAGWFRLDGSGGSDASDRIRSGLAGQAWADFLHSPVHGIGFEVLVQGHNLVLQTLASGGLVLFAAYLLAQFGFLLDAWSVHDRGAGVGRALAVCGGAFLLVGMLSNQIADLFVAVPFALVAGLCAAASPRTATVPRTPTPDHRRGAPAQEETRA